MNKLNNRLKSLAWRAGGTAFVSVLSLLLAPENLQALNEAGLVVPGIVVAFLSLLVGEITKYLNKKEA